MPPTVRAVQQNATKKGNFKGKEKPATGQQTPASTTEEPTEPSGVTKVEAKARESVKPPRRMKNYKAKKKRKKIKKQKHTTKDTTGANAMSQPQDTTLATCSQEGTVAQREEGAVESSDESSAAESTNTLETQKKTSENSTERIEGSSGQVQNQESPHNTQKPKGMQDVSPVKMEVESVSTLPKL